MMKPTLQPPAGGELVPDVEKEDIFKKGPDAEWTQRQPLVDVSKVKPKAGTEIVTSESAGFWWVVNADLERRRTATPVEFGIDVHGQLAARPSKAYMEAGI